MTSGRLGAPHHPRDARDDGWPPLTLHSTGPCAGNWPQEARSGRFPGKEPVSRCRGSSPGPRRRSRGVCPSRPILPGPHRLSPGLSTDPVDIMAGCPRFVYPAGHRVRPAAAGRSTTPTRSPGRGRRRPRGPRGPARRGRPRRPDPQYAATGVSGSRAGPRAGPRAGFEQDAEPVVGRHPAVLVEGGGRDVHRTGDVAGAGVERLHLAAVALAGPRVDDHPVGGEPRGRVDVDGRELSDGRGPAGSARRPGARRSPAACPQRPTRRSRRPAPGPGVRPTGAPTTRARRRTSRVRRTRRGRRPAPPRAPRGPRPAWSRRGAGAGRRAGRRYATSAPPRGRGSARRGGDPPHTGAVRRPERR